MDSKIGKAIVLDISWMLFLFDHWWQYKKYENKIWAQNIHAMIYGYLLGYLNYPWYITDKDLRA